VSEKGTDTKQKKKKEKEKAHFGSHQKKGDHLVGRGRGRNRRQQPKGGGTRQLRSSAGCRKILLIAEAERSLGNRKRGGRLAGRKKNKKKKKQKKTLCTTAQKKETKKPHKPKKKKKKKTQQKKKRRLPLRHVTFDGELGILDFGKKSAVKRIKKRFVMKKRDKSISLRGESAS